MARVSGGKVKKEQVKKEQPAKTDQESCVPGII